MIPMVDGGGSRPGGTKGRAEYTLKVPTLIFFSFLFFPYSFSSVLFLCAHSVFITGFAWIGCLRICVSAPTFCAKSYQKDPHQTKGSIINQKVACKS